LRVVVRQHKRRVPVPAIARALPFALATALSLAEAAALSRCLRPDGGAFAGAEVAPAQAAVLAAPVDQVGVVGIDGTAEAVAAAHADPVLVDGAGLITSAARPAPGAVVLQSAIDLVVAPRVEGDVVELADGQVVEVVPVGPTVVGDVEAAVTADDHVPAVL